MPTLENQTQMQMSDKKSNMKVRANKVKSVSEKTGMAIPTTESSFDIKAVLKESLNGIEHKIDETVSPLLEHIGDYINEPFDILESYFDGKPLERLARHQLESYNNFVNYQMQRTIEMFNPITIMSDNDYDEKTNTYGLVIKIYLKNLRFQHPQIHENNGATKIMMPQEARLRNFTYSSNSIVDLNIEFIIRNENGEVKIKEKQMPKIKLCSLPVMLKSSICILTQYKQVSNVLTGECDMDCGGYFIIKGSEKTVLCQERAAENRIYVFNGKNTPKWDWVAEFKSVPDSKCISPKQVELMVSSKTNVYGHGIYVLIPRLKQKRYIELFVLFRALGVLSDKKICEYILLNVDDDSNKDLLSYLEASMEDAKPILKSGDTIQEDAFEHVMSMVAYNPYLTEKGPMPMKKREYTLELFQNDFFPHCKSLEQKLFLLGFMANRLIRTALGWNPPDDRDSYLNKRIELTGTLLNNLFRNHYIRFVKDIEKQVIREINLGAWKSSEDYENIINMTNIYKIIKPTTIENGLNRALSTGDFSVKQSSSSSKVGVAQVLNRLTYLGTLSHLRRVNTPLDKNGELVAPRKLHNTTFGFLCVVESPEGASIGIVKNISYMTHLTIPTQSESLYIYVAPYIVRVEDVKSPTELYNEVKVFINGSWVGVSKDPIQLYQDLKDKKYKGIINIYTSIVFDYGRMEIRVCNDGGRLTRPVFKVKDNKVLITKEIIDKLKKKELQWNDLITNCNIEESVIEYIDPEEQNHAMIAMKFRGNYLHDKKHFIESMRMKYDYCEIHPSTILGVLASCVPFPDCNQAPRNTYQCLDPNEIVYMADGSKKKIGEIKIGETVMTFHPETFEQSQTKVVNQFVRQNEYPIYKITTVCGREITATGDHKFMTNIGWATVDQMINNTDIKIGINTSEYSVNSKTVTFNSISTITKYPDGLISDIEVESENHSFISSYGFLSSNCAMAKQAIGISSMNYDKRMDKTTYILNNPTRPLVDTRIMEFLQLNRIPSGCQIHVAIMSYTGYNQEDSVLINKAAIDRGLFSATIYHTEKDEDKNVIRDEIIRCKPDPTKTKGIKHGNYSKINMHGFIPENTVIENRDIIISKVIPIKENRNDPTKIIKYEDQSKSFRTTEETYVDKNYTGRNGEGCNFAKSRVRIFRKPVIGDKFCLTDDHDVLTLNRGWIPIANITMEDRVAQLNRKTNKLEYVNPLETLVFDHEGDMYEVETPDISQKVTLNHRMWVKRRYHTEYELIQAKDIIGEIVRFQCGGSPIVNNDMEIQFGNQLYRGLQADMILVILGVIMINPYICKTDSTSHRIEIDLANKLEFSTALNEAFELLGISYSFCIISLKWRFNHKELYHEFEKYIVGGAVNKSLPQWTKLLSARQSEILLNSMCLHGENSSTSLNFSTLSTKLRDDVQILAQHSGYTAKYRKIVTAKETTWDISIRKKRLYPTMDTEEDVEKNTQFVGKVYCLRVPSEVFLVRRNGRCSFTGNSSRHGQKGTVGNIVLEYDMPFTKDGLKPDIIINPHAIPSRMTIAHLKETLLGKVLLQLGMFGDGTSFGNLDVYTIAQELQKCGYESYGNEILYDGQTGKQLETSIFIGPVYYQRLKHMVNDKEHSRSIGPVVNLTRQPAEGRSRDGGFRIGEMERDVMIAHGMSKFCRERMYDVADKYSLHVCKKCGMVATFNNGDKGIMRCKQGFSVHKCSTCDNITDFAYVEVPYAFKLMSQELQTINIVPRLITT